jgi:glycosyltransferase involved in cell wall biosynthesis
MVSSGVKRNLVVTAGRAAPEKRLDLFWSVARRCPDFEFVMLLTSNSYDREYSLKLVRECPKNGKIVFDPPKAAYDRVLGEAKVYLHLMQGEHFGITIVEAMSAGCVPIVHDSGGPRETVNDRTGFRWQTEKEIPGMVEAAIGNSPSTAAEERAQLFNRARFDERLASIFSGL